MNIVPIILAGGIGERFWPLSRSTMPKQLLKLAGNRTMAEQTLARVKAFSTQGVVPLIITGQAIAKKMRSVLPRSLKYDMIVEPVGKNTAPAVALAAAYASATYGDSILVVLSADHIVSPGKIFTDAVRYAAKLANTDNRLVVFGIRPSRPETGYGYLQLGKKVEGTGSLSAYDVKRFVEKPSIAKARQYMDSGSYMWNSGMFVWKASVILEEFKSYMPDLHKLAMTAAKKHFSQSAVDSFYSDCAKESIDYGIMEQSGRVSAIVADFEWDDIGSWESVGRVHGHNGAGTTIVGKNIYESETRNTIILNNSPLAISVVGIDNAVVVTTDDAVLVVDRSRLPDLKKHLAAMKNDQRFSRKLF